MSQIQNGPGPVASVEEVQRDWHDLVLRVQQLEAGQIVLEQENKVLRSLVERVIEHRQKSHSELVNLLATLVSRLPINDIGVVVARLVEHNQHVNEVCAQLAKGKMDDNLLQPAILKQLDKIKRDLTAAFKPEIEALIKSDAPYEAGLLESLLAKPEDFFTPAFSRANRGFVKGQVARERILREFGRFERQGTLPNMIRGNDDSNRDTSDAPLWFGVAAARKGWLTRQDVVNCLPLGKIETLLKNKRTR